MNTGLSWPIGLEIPLFQVSYYYETGVVDFKPKWRRYILYTIYYILHSVYNSHFKDTLKKTKLFTSPGVKTRNLFMWNKKIEIQRTFAPSVGCTIKGIIFFLNFLHESIIYWARAILAINIVRTISSHD